MKEEQIKRAAIAVAETEAGIILFRALAETCGFHLADLVVNRATGIVDPIATTLNVERRRVYLDFRRHLPAEMLAKIEFPAPVAAEEQTAKKEEK